MVPYYGHCLVDGLRSDAIDGASNVTVGAFCDVFSQPPHVRRMHRGDGHHASPGALEQTVYIARLVRASLCSSLPLSSLFPLDLTAATQYPDYDMPSLCKTLRSQWNRLRGRTPDEERQLQEQPHRSASAPPTRRTTTPISRQSVGSRPVTPTSLPATGRTRDTAQAARSPLSSAGTDATEIRTGAAPGSAPGPHGEGTRSGSKETKEVHSKIGEAVKGAVRTALDVTESLSDGVPFLSGAVKSLKTGVEVYEVGGLHLWVC